MRTALWCFVVLISSSGCSVAPESGVGSASGSAAQITQEFALNLTLPVALVLVVDDAPTVDAALLRHRVGRALEAMLEDDPELRRPFDPAAWHPVDYRVFVARPSASGAARIVGPSGRPPLAWTTRFATIDGARALSDAAELELAAVLSSPGNPYELLDTAAGTVALLTGNRGASNDDEAPWAAAVDTRQTDLRVIVATTRDDEGALEPEAYGIGPLVGYGLATSVIMPATGGWPHCALTLAGLPASRVGRWARAQDDNSREPVATWGWPCSEDLVAGALFGKLVIDHGSCPPLPVATLEDGRAACVLSITTPGELPCPVERGWADPTDADGMRHPRTVSSDGGSARVCEIQQLEGAALAACRTTPACDGCGSGWCTTEVKEYAAPCIANQAVRFVGGALAGARGLLHVTCNLQGTE